MQKKLLKLLFQVTASLFFILITVQAEAYDSHFATDIDHRSCMLLLEDGSEWKVSNFDSNELFVWKTQSLEIPVKITPNYFSNYFTYYITNQNTGSYVRANLVTSPLRNNPYAITITGIDNNSYERGSVYLSNGTFWHVHFSDLELIRNWYLDDLIIIGKNNNWFSYNTHILINIHTNTFVRVQRL